MNLSEILSVDRIKCHSAVDSKKVALEELAQLLASAEKSFAYMDIFNCLINREKLGSTGLGSGVAIPHGRQNNCDKTYGAFLKLHNGIDFDAIDQKPVDLIFALLVPEDSTDEHLQVLAQLAEKFSHEKLLKDLRSTDDTETIFNILTRDVNV